MRPQYTFSFILKIANRGVHELVDESYSSDVREDLFVCAIRTKLDTEIMPLLSSAASQSSDLKVLDLTCFKLPAKLSKERLVLLGLRTADISCKKAKKKDDSDDNDSEEEPAPKKSRSTAKKQLGGRKKL